MPVDSVTLPKIKSNAAADTNISREQVDDHSEQRLELMGHDFCSLEMFVSAAALLLIFGKLSSVASVIGNMGQANYSAGNGFIDALMEWRRSHGLPGTGHGRQRHEESQAFLLREQMVQVKCSADLGLGGLASLMLSWNGDAVMVSQDIPSTSASCQMPVGSVTCHASNDLRRKGKFAVDDHSEQGLELMGHDFCSLEMWAG
jgi:hypothetical protein